MLMFCTYRTVVFPYYIPFMIGFGDEREANKSKTDARQYTLSHARGHAREETQNPETNVEIKQMSPVPNPQDSKRALQGNSH